MWMVTFVSSGGTRGWPDGVCLPWPAVRVRLPYPHLSSAPPTPPAAVGLILESRKCFGRREMPRYCLEYCHRLHCLVHLYRFFFFPLHVRVILLFFTVPAPWCINFYGLCYCFSSSWFVTLLFGFRVGEDSMEI